MGPPHGAILEQKLPFNLRPEANFPLVGTEAAPPPPILFSISQGGEGSENKRVRFLVITLSSLSTEEQMVRNLLSGTPQIENIPSRMRRSFTCRHPGHSEERISLHDPQ